MRTSARNTALTCAMLALVILPLASATAGPARFELTKAVPNDVFFCVNVQHNPEREFLEAYWEGVFEAFHNSGIVEDVFSLIGTVGGAEAQAETQRIREKAVKLIAGVKWRELADKEFLFAERYTFPEPGPTFVMKSMPFEMVAMMRGTTDAAGDNHAGFVAIVQGILDEINRALNEEMVVIRREQRQGADIATIALADKGASALPVTFAICRHKDTILIVFGEDMLSDVLAILGGSGDAKPLADDARYRKAMAQLPKAEDSVVFFDMQRMLNSFRGMIDFAASEAGKAGDVTLNVRHEGEAYELSAQAYQLYAQKEYAKALELNKQAYKLDPDDSRLIYNLACMYALNGEEETALDLLEKAVAKGFYAPGQISGDADFAPLREDPRFKAALAKATKMAKRESADDTVLNSAETGKVREMMKSTWPLWKEKKFEEALAIMEEAYELAPDDSRVLYYLACLHALLGKPDQALDYLDRAVERGFYAPNHMAKDSDLDNLREMPQFAVIMDKARDGAGEHDTNDAQRWLDLVDHGIHNIGVLDYIVAVESTDGYSVKTQTVAQLVPDAKKRAIYPFISSIHAMDDFDRFLPKETASFSVSGGMDLDALYSFIEDAIRRIGPEGEKLLAQFDGFQQQFGLNIREDVFAWIQGDSYTVTLDDGAGSVMLMKVNDEAVAREKVNAAMEFVTTGLGELIKQNPALGMLTATRSPLVDDRLEGFENLQFMVSPQPIVWGVTDGHLIFGSSADAVAMCLATAKGEHPSVRENERVMAEALVPSGSFAAVSLTDQRKLGQEIAEGLGMAAMGVGMMGAFIPDPEVRPVLTRVGAMLGKLTPVVRKIDFFKSTASVTTFDGKAFHSTMVVHYVSPAEHAKMHGATTASATP